MAPYANNASLVGYMGLICLKESENSEMQLREQAVVYLRKSLKISDCFYFRYLLAQTTKNLKILNPSNVQPDLLTAKAIYDLSKKWCVAIKNDELIDLLKVINKQDPFCDYKNYFLPLYHALDKIEAAKLLIFRLDYDRFTVELWDLVLELLEIMDFASLLEDRETWWPYMHDFKWEIFGWNF